MALTLSSDERTELERAWADARFAPRTPRAPKVMLADGVAYSTIEATVWCYRDYINRWRRGFVADRLAGLQSRHQGQPPTVFTPALEAHILAKTQQRPPDGSTHWTRAGLKRTG
jgi:hypothetical protein